MNEKKPAVWVWGKNLLPILKKQTPEDLYKLKVENQQKLIDIIN